ncbi:hypothetical protein L249_1205 [Ophiocordyceps polyrhachis-furcata BCC 54312]|uniref:Methyltransferase type 11 domain-containing protein n=1 Tax=Ophiocordyceps polyrhachis-furcata BCC 54312 TaxID=1330021 RepID=A0A367LGF6_9HYPO|nr:hypothetical protein L249_1205 [Ophiocordyceps polyrhachis-furcata BCC 54312]
MAVQKRLQSQRRQSLLGRKTDREWEISRHVEGAGRIWSHRIQDGIRSPFQSGRRAPDPKNSVPDRFKEADHLRHDSVGRSTTAVYIDPANRSSSTYITSTPGLSCPECLLVHFAKCSSSSPKRASHGQLRPSAAAAAAKDAALTVEPATIYPELDRYRDCSADRVRNIDAPPNRLAVQDGPPQTPSSIFFSGSSSSQISGSPSTRLSESPGPGPYSRDTTPTSISSQSPPIFFSSSSRLKDVELLNRPPVTWMRANEAKDPSNNGLASVRESMTSSSSGSTVRAAERNTKNRLSASLPPSPPERKSSQNVAKSRFYSGTVRSAQRPGELSPPARPSLSSRTRPPRRPSRDGTQDIASQPSEPVCVIQSKLSSVPRSFDRQASEPTLSRPRLGSLPQVSRNTSTPQLPTVRDKSSSKAEGARSVADQPKKLANPVGASRPNYQAPSPKSGTSSFTTRFPFFGRKKTAPEGVVEDDRPDGSRQKKAGRKGPVAGTGHEGYGRVGFVRRRSSSSSSTAGKSAEPQPSPANRDSFLADRVHPVVIAGGEVVDNQNTPVSSPESEKASPQRRSTSQSRALPKKPSRISRWPTVGLHDDSSTLSNPFESRNNADDAQTPKPSLAFRRSLQRLRSSPDNPLRLPQPIKVDVAVSASPPLTSIDASVASDESRFQLRKEVSCGSNSYPAAKKAQKRDRLPRKWNFFGRSHSRLKMRENGEEVKAAVVAVDRKRVAYYAMMEQDDGRLGSVRDEPDSSSPNLVSAHNTVENQSQVRPPCAGNEPPPPPPPPPRSNPPVSSRPSRLPQVGRIPKVVPSHAASPAFCRPFRSSGQAFPSISPGVYDPESIATGPTPPRSSTPTTAAAAGVGSCHEFVFKLSPDVGEFLTLSPRQQQSDEATDSSSSGSRGVRLFADATAVIPEPNDPLDEDEIWDEYNDLLDEGAARRFLTSMLPADDSSRRTDLHDGVSTDKRKTACSHSTSGSADMTERIRRAFRPHAENRLSSASDRTMFTDCSAISDDESPWAQVNLRVGSMTVSKWLTFGHVLFSDIRHELDSGNVSILVVDGLGNDDWSFYAAETYPKASFYNLSPRAALSAEMQKSPSSFPLSPANHHQVQYMSHLDKFPFAPQSFNCVVYRFPVAGPESHYRNIINEARRVLVPGGLIELSVLDADLNSMGNRGRRAVRCLKERIHAEAGDVNLSSTADLVLRLLGKACFSNIRVARVGVPVASSITRPEMMGNKAKQQQQQQQRHGPSLADMMKDDSPMADESITKLVTRVGRWWYTRCYEKVASSSSSSSSSSSPSSSGSIWLSKQLLSECEELGTSLKLMVCCARAPDRVPSV